MPRIKHEATRLATTLLLALSLLLAVPGAITARDNGLSSARALDPTAAQVGFGVVARDHQVDPNQGGRKAASFKDGPYIRIVEIAPGNVVRVYSNENDVLYEDYGISAYNVSIQSISTERSTFSGALVLIFGGFTPDTGNSRTITLVTSYAIQPAVEGMGLDLPGVYLPGWYQGGEP